MYVCMYINVHIMLIDSCSDLQLPCIEIQFGFSVATVATVHFTVIQEIKFEISKFQKPDQHNLFVNITETVK